MLVLYDKDSQEFETLGIGVLRDLKSDPLITEVLNGLFNLEFDYVKEGWLSEYLIEGNIIKADGQLFRIRNVDKDIKDTKITILAKHIWFDNELNNWIEDVAPTDKVGHLALKWLLDNAKETNKFTITGDCTKIESARYVRMDPIEAIYNADNAILNRFGGELEIDNFNITLHRHRGSNTGVEIRQKKNLTGAKYSVDLSTIATRIMPIGNDGLLLPEKYIDSPLLNNYYAPFYYKLDVDVGVDEEAGITLGDCYAKMRQSVQELFDLGIDKPSVTISIDFVELSKTKEYEQYSSLETAHLGDSCKVYIPGLNINLTTRIVKIVKNLNKNRITSIELGTPKVDYVTSNNKTTNEIQNIIAKVNPTSILEKAKENATELINHPFGGYIYISEDTGELYIMDTNDVSTAQNIWKFGLGGIGFSSTGISGPYGIAITQDGAIVADFITAGHINTNLIEGYNELVAQVNTIVDLTDFIRTKTGNNIIRLDNTVVSDGAINKLKVKGLSPMPLYPGMTFPHNYTYPGVLTMYELIFDSSDTLTENASHVYIQSPIPLRTYNDVCDEIIIENNIAYVIQKIGLDSNNELYELTNPISHYVGNVTLPTYSGETYIYLKYFSNAIYECEYIIQNGFTRNFATKSETQAIVNITDEITMEVQNKCGKDEVVNQLNISKDAILIRGNRFLLEADNLTIDQQGNIYLNDGSKVIGGDGLLTNLQFSSGDELKFLGFEPYDTIGLSSGNSYNNIVINAEIPDNFTIVSAIITLIHSPVNYLDGMASSSTYYWGYARKVKAYKTIGLENFYKCAVLFSSLYQEGGGTLQEISGSFGSNGFTANSASDSSHSTQVVYSSDIKDALTAGWNRIVLQSADTMPYNSDFEQNAVLCSQKTGSAIAILNVFGYTSFE